MADRFAKNPTAVRAGTSVKVDVGFNWFGGKNKNIELKGDFTPKCGPNNWVVTPEMKKKAEEFWAKFTNKGE